MELKKDFITKENSKKLLDSILLSIKSNENIRVIDNNQHESKSGGLYQNIKSSSINIKRHDDRKISSFSVSINRFDVHRWFKPTTYRYELLMETSTDSGYSSDRYKTSIDDNQDIIGKIYNFLLDIEKNKKIEETNKTLETIIGDISTTIEKKYRRDETINEILN